MSFPVLALAAKVATEHAENICRAVHYGGLIIRTTNASHEFLMVESTYPTVDEPRTMSSSYNLG